MSSLQLHWFITCSVRIFLKYGKYTFETVVEACAIILFGYGHVFTCSGNVFEM